MVQIKRILCPVDFSDASNPVCAQALTIAGWYGATVALLHVHADGDVTDAMQRLCCAATAAGAGAAGIPVNVLVETGDAATTIVDCAANQDADLIVIGSHGANGFERLLLGSVTDGVLRHAGCPVLVVPPHARGTSRLPFKHLLCPIDFSSASLTGLALACSLAQEIDAELTLLHVRDLPLENDLITTGPFAYPDNREQDEHNAHIALKGLIPNDLRTSRPPVTLVTHGKPYQEILRIAAEQSVDLIVSGVHGRHMLDLLIFGSTTNQVIRRATCPVLSVRR